MKLLIRGSLCTFLLVCIFLVTTDAFTVHSRGNRATAIGTPLAAPLKSQQDDAAANSMSDDDVAQPPKPAVKCPDCDKCDGSGRILGGIAVVLPWWPIKAYRPCPNFIAKGGFYERSGQGLDEIAFGRDSTFEK